MAPLGQQTAPERCASKCPQPAIPAGITAEQATTDVRYRHLLAPLRCSGDHEPGELHAAGSLTWHDPPLYVRGG